MLTIFKNKTMKISSDGIKFISQFEGFKAKPYLDSVGVCTIGYGSTTYKDGTHVKISDVAITMEAALDLLQSHVDLICIMYIIELVKVPLNQSQIDSLCSFIYNVGGGAFSTSTLLRLINSGNSKNKQAINNAFILFNKGKVDGYEIPIIGLTDRRIKEATLFLS